MAEVSRLDTIAADQQKGDFIGSISHELRSPLHGILASAEFLGETECDSFQRSLVDTIDSCGRTLLDTINHVLDFSKINAFERNMKKKSVNRASSVTSSGRLPQMPQILNIYAVTDVAAICEEVVEGVYAGQVYQDINSADLAADMTPGMRGRTFQHSPTDDNRSSFGGTGSQYASKAVDVVLDIEPGDYTFTTQPGALRRVIM
jgi:signal transduction histidine kinase